jgi:biotin carboxylase
VGVAPDDGRDRLLVLGAGPAQLGLLRAARARGLRTVVCDRDRAAVGLRYADRHALVSTEDEEGIEEVARAEGVAGLIAPGIDWPVAIAARVAARLGLPHPVPPDVAEATVSKVRQREAFAAAGVPQPRWRLVSSADAVEELPCVVKPPDRQGQVAVSLVREPDELRPALEEALAASRGGAALVEEWVDGPEVTVNGFSVDGHLRALTVTDRLTAESPAFGVALAHTWPSTQAVEAAVEAAEGAAAALGVREGPTYTQIRMAPDGPRVIELAARLGGGQDGALCDAALGIDLNALALGSALGRRVEVPPARPVGGACVAFLVPPPGILRSVEGLEEARELPGVVDAVAYRPPGWRFVPLRVGADRAGFVLTRGDSREEALAVAARAADLVRFVVDPAAASPSP